MITLEDQVTSKDLSMRLKALGVPQRSLFFWVNGELSNGYNMASDMHGNKVVHSYASEYSAYTASEIGQWLPADIDDYYNLHIMKDPKIHCYYVFYKPKASGTERLVTRGSNNLAEAMGLMLEYLLKEGLLEINKEV